MDLELHQLEMRYEALRKRNPRHERTLITSLLEVGQQLPIVVVAAGEQRFVVIDGYKRVRALRQLCRDTVRAMVWAVGEEDALLLEQLMRAAGPDALEQGWLLAELQARFGLSTEALSRRCDKSTSWVSRRLGLVKELPSSIQAQVRQGQIAAHAAMKYLVPLARANAKAAKRLAEGLGSWRPSTRQVELLYQGWQAGTERTRELILATPQLYLKTLEVQQPRRAAPSPLQQLHDDLGALRGAAQRACRRLEQGAMQKLMPEEPEELAQLVEKAKAATQALFTRMQQESGHVG